MSDPRELLTRRLQEMARIQAPRASMTEEERWEIIKGITCVHCRVYAWGPACVPLFRTQWHHQSCPCVSLANET
jgi:hypothetical protein